MCHTHKLNISQWPKIHAGIGQCAFIRVAKSMVQLVQDRSEKLSVGDIGRDVRVCFTYQSWRLSCSCWSDTDREGGKGKLMRLRTTTALSDTEREGSLDSRCNWETPGFSAAYVVLPHSCSPHNVLHSSSCNALHAVFMLVSVHSVLLYCGMGWLNYFSLHILISCLSIPWICSLLFLMTRERISPISTFRLSTASVENPPSS